jgi:hypothetical protein
MARLLKDAGMTAAANDPRDVIRRLVRHGWLAGLSVRGAWAFFPPGVDDLADPYIHLRGWRAIDKDVVFLLAGTCAAFHLGYLPRRPERVTIWLPEKTALPAGLRKKVSVVKTTFPRASDVRRLSPGLPLLKQRGLDITSWATGLPAFGPEALIVQMAQRPASIESWLDLSSKLADLARDVDIERLKALLSMSSAAARQRAAYFMHLGGRTDFQSLLPAEVQAVELGDDGPGHWHNATGVNDHLLMPLLGANAKG